MLSGTTFAETHLDACARHEAGTFMSILRSDAQLQVGECQLSVTVRKNKVMLKWEKFSILFHVFLFEAKLANLSIWLCC